MTAPKVGCHLIIFGQAGRDDLDGTLATVKAAGQAANQAATTVSKTKKAA